MPTLVVSDPIKEDIMGATHPHDSADDAGTEVPTEGFTEGNPDEEPDQEGAASPEANEYGKHPADDPDLSGEDRFDAG